MKIHIFGASGSGITTLGQTLTTELNLAYFDSDDYFWPLSDPPYTQNGTLKVISGLMDNS